MIGNQLRVVLALTALVLFGIVGAAVFHANHSPPHWAVTCTHSHTVVARHFDNTRGITLPRYTIVCDEWADVWVGEPGISRYPVPPEAPNWIANGTPRDTMSGH